MQELWRLVAIFLRCAKWRCSKLDSSKSRHIERRLSPHQASNGDRQNGAFDLFQKMWCFLLSRRTTCEIVNRCPCDDFLCGQCVREASLSSKSSPSRMGTLTSSKECHQHGPSRQAPEFQEALRCCGDSLLPDQKQKIWRHDFSNLPEKRPSRRGSRPTERETHPCHVRRVSHTKETHQQPGGAPKHLWTMTRASPLRRNHQGGQKY